jgi:hypothetical protein
MNVRWTRKLKSAYASIGIIILTTIVLVVVADIVTSSVLSVRRYLYGRKNMVFRKYGPDVNARNLRVLYPDLSFEDVGKLWNETWSRPKQFEPFTMIREKAYTGKFVNISKHGYRCGKDVNPWPPPSDKRVVFFFGGSTTFGFGVPDWQTIPAQLETMLSNDCLVYNFGRGAYYSDQERVLFEVLLQKHKPDVAVFMDGLNEFYFYDGPGTGAACDGAFRQDFRYGLRIVLMHSSLYRVAARICKPKSVDEQVSLLTDDQLFSVIRRYHANRKMISGICDEFGIVPLFVWQPVPTYGYDQRFHPFKRVLRTWRHGSSRRGYALFAHEGIPKERFLWLADMQRSEHRPLYVDSCHYTAAFSRRIAKSIAGVVK